MTFEEQRAARQRAALDEAQPAEAEGRAGRAGRPSRTTAQNARPTFRAMSRSGQMSDAPFGGDRQSRPERTSRPSPQQRELARPSISLWKILLVVVLLVGVVMLVRLCSTASTIDVTVNGSHYTLHGAKTLQTALNESGLPINPGDLISLRGQVLEKKAGNAFNATVNGEKTTDAEYKLNDGDELVITDGEDIVEDYDAVQESIPFSIRLVGTGSLCTFTPGQDGVLEIRTGKISGDVVEKQVVDPTSLVCTQYDPNVGSKKTIALTFGKGPAEDYTADILDVLAKNDVKATFFFVGTQVEEYGDLVRRAHDEGHQVCTNTYDYAEAGNGLNIADLTAEEQVAEVEDGRAAITEALGTEASRAVRLPGGYVDENIAFNLASHVDAIVGWSLDSGDWMGYSADAIYDALMQAEPGDIILCHDGDGDREETVEALEKAIPALLDKGFTFATVDEMLEFPAS